MEDDILIFVQEQVWLIAALLILFAAFYRRETQAGGSKLSLSEVVQAMNADKGVLIDVRDKKEFDAGHIANAIHIPHAKVANSLSQLEKYKDKQIIVTDQMGQHAGSVSRLLMKQGYNAARMRGGMSEWKQDGLPLVK